MIILIVKDKPTPKGRPRLGRGKVYTPKRTKDAESIIAWEAKQIMAKNGMAPYECELGVEIMFCYKRNRSSGEYPSAHDLDNLCKLVLDSLNKIVYKDDRQVTKLCCYKHYGESDYILIKVYARPEEFDAKSCML